MLMINILRSVDSWDVSRRGTEIVSIRRLRLVRTIFGVRSWSLVGTTAGAVASAGSPDVEMPIA